METGLQPDGVPRVSVVIPCYEQAHFLPEAVASVLGQTYRSFEIIVVDDGSPDETSDVAERLAAEHPESSIRLVRRENGGLSSARNSGVAAARGEYVLPLDADDAISPRFLEEAVRALDADPAVSIAYGPHKNFGADSSFHPSLEYDLRLLVRINFIGVASLYRRQAWEDVGGYSPMDSYEDWEFWISCGERGHSGKRVPGALFHYRVRANSMFAEATKRDQRLKAEIVLYHPRLFSTGQVEWARGVLAGKPLALAIDERVGEIPELPGDRPHWSGARLLGSRSVSVLAFADELFDSPRLLEAWSRTFDEDDDVTLAVCGGDQGRFAALAGEISADLVGLPGEARDSPQLAQWADALYTRRAPDVLHRGLPRLDESGLEGLREHARSSRRPCRAAAA